ncbi:MAG: hypothetical protein MKZ60_04975 [Candidatus Thalassarchaeum sp.]|nr:hypothetical protein [Candidatus Thalassarchaeum sp.]
MRVFHLWLAITALALASSCVSAESYSISGTATYSNSVPVEIGKIQVECEEFEYDCHTCRGIEATTDRKGEFTITLELDESYDGAEIFLALKGERFSHTIDLEESRSPPSGSVNHDISLQQGSPPAPLFTGLACGGAVIAIAFIAALDRKPAPTVSRAQQRTTALEIVSCPICGEKTESYLLIRHLIVDHEIDPSEASAIAETASSEEE